MRMSAGPRTAERPKAPEYTPRQLRAFFKRARLNDVVIISNHAIDRYRERFQRELSKLDCRRGLYAAMRDRGRFTPSPPKWLFHAVQLEVSRENVGYIVIDDAVALPLRANIEKRPGVGGRRARPYIAVSCLSADLAKSARFGILRQAPRWRF
jgi:hypothetical protein